MFWRWLRFLFVSLSILFFGGIVAVVLTGGYAFEFLGMSFSSNSLKQPLVGFTVFALLSFALSVKPADFALSLTAIVFSLLVIEFGLRVLNPPQAAAAFVQIHQPSDVYSYELKPNSRGVGLLGEQVSINSRGARDGEFDPNKPGPRIVVLGDSFAFGMGVEMEENFVEQIEALMSREHSEVQVINLGVIAYTFWQYLELLERRVLHYSPDLVIVAFFMDDIAGGKHPEEVVPRQVFDEVHEDWWSGVRLINFIRNFVVVMETKILTRRGADYLASIEKRKRYLQLEDPDHLYAQIQQGALESSILEEFSSGVDFLAAWSVRTNVPVLVVFIPDASQIHEVDRQVVNEIAASEFERAAIPFLDVTPHFEAIEDTRSLFLFPLDAHTSKQGHALIAQAIVEHPLVVRLK